MTIDGNAHQRRGRAEPGDRSGAVRETLLDIETSDGLIMPGAHLEPADAARETCLIWFAGFGASYDAPPMLRAGRLLAAQGIGMLLGATRGQHGAVTTWQRRGEGWGTQKTGTWFEVYTDSTRDIDGWIAEARSLGYRRVIVGGHSFGGVRVAYWLSTSDTPVDGIVLGSPSLGIQDLDPGVLTLADELVAEGRGEELLPDGSWKRGFGTRTVSAQTYASWRAVRDQVFIRRRDWQSGVTAPTLVFYGADDVGGPEQLELFTEFIPPATGVTTRILPGVTHNYEGHSATIADAISAWWHDRQGKK